jgi:hypothetical protein
VEVEAVADDNDTTMADLIRRSSLGRPDAKRLASLTSSALVAQVLSAASASRPRHASAGQAEATALTTLREPIIWGAERAQLHDELGIDASATSPQPGASPGTNAPTADTVAEIDPGSDQPADTVPRANYAATARPVDRTLTWGAQAPAGKPAKGHRWRARTISGTRWIAIAAAVAAAVIVSSDPWGVFGTPIEEPQAMNIPHEHTERSNDGASGQVDTADPITQTNSPAGPSQTSDSGSLSTDNGRPGEAGPTGATNPPDPWGGAPTPTTQVDTIPPSRETALVRGCNTYGNDCNDRPLYAEVPPQGYDPTTWPTVTTVSNGTILTARCWKIGGVTANFDPPDSGPDPYESDVYFNVQFPSSQWVWIPDTYFVRDKTHRMGLPTC